MDNELKKLYILLLKYQWTVLKCSVLSTNEVVIYIAPAIERHRYSSGMPAARTDLFGDRFIKLTPNEAKE